VAGEVGATDLRIGGTHRGEGREGSSHTTATVSMSAASWRRARSDRSGLWALSRYVRRRASSVAMASSDG
jgi:hypothetical protein